LEEKNIALNHHNNKQAGIDHVHVYTSNQVVAIHADIRLFARRK
jgi:hypothetical protein